MNNPPNEPARFATCPCQHCGGGIEFDASHRGESVACPHCSLATVLFVSASQKPPPLPTQLQIQSVKGTILDFTVQTNAGIISGDDGKRYSFQGSEWREAGKYPTKGMRVDFSPQAGSALAIYEASGLQNSGFPTPFGQRPLPYQGSYRSSDEGIFGGVCAGIAHKLNMSRVGLRVAFVILGFLWFIGLVAYVVCWIVFKPLPTRGVTFSD